MNHKPPLFSSIQIVGEPLITSATPTKDRRSVDLLDGVYIAAQVHGAEMQRMFREELAFTLGDALEVLKL
jgi:hypothetical protein